MDRVTRALPIILQSNFATGAMKSFLHHYGYRYMVHRPEEKVFSKQAVCISTAAGAGMRSTIKDMADSTFFWDCARTYKLGIAVMETRWEMVKPKIKRKIEKKTDSIAKKILSREGKGMDKRKETLEKMTEFRNRKVKFSSADVKQIYYDSFPKNERMPFPMMVAMSKLWNTEFLEFFDGDTLCGFVYYAHIGEIVFVMFFAVDKTLRSKGYGSAILREMQNKYPDKKIIISIEPCDPQAPDIEVRRKRKDFYMRNGYKETGYMMKLNGVVQEIIIANGEFGKKQFRIFFLLYSNGTMWPQIWKQT